MSNDIENNDFVAFTNMDDVDDESVEKVNDINDIIKRSRKIEPNFLFIDYPEEVPDCVVEGLEDAVNNNFASKSDFVSGDYDE